MEGTSYKLEDRVRKNTSRRVNMKIDTKIQKNIDKYRSLSAEEIDARIVQLKKEWDIERLIQLNAASVAFAGLLLGTVVNRRWYALSWTVAGWLLVHGIQGWYPPMRLFRMLGFRTQQEIDEEIYALRMLKGDFNDVSDMTTSEKLLNLVRS